MWKRFKTVTTEPKKGRNNANANTSDRLRNNSSIEFIEILLKSNIGLHSQSISGRYFRYLVVFGQLCARIYVTLSLDGTQKNTRTHRATQSTFFALQNTHCINVFTSFLAPMFLFSSAPNHCNFGKKALAKKTNKNCMKNA